MSEVPIHEVVQVLVAGLGTVKVAYLAGIKSRQMPHRWASPPGHYLHAVPRNEPRKRLRAAHLVLTIIAAKEGMEVASRWLRSGNPELYYKTPIDLVREFGDDIDSVITAAKEFISPSP